MINRMKNFYFSYRNTKGEIIYDNSPILAHDVIEAETKMLDWLRQCENPFFKRKDLLEVSDTPFTNKKYYFIWYNVATSGMTVDFVSAKNETEAKQVAVLLTKFYTNNKSSYTTENIKIAEFSDDYFYDMERVQEKIKVWSKRGFCPDLKELM